MSDQEIDFEIIDELPPIDEPLELDDSELPPMPNIEEGQGKEETITRASAPTESDQDQTTSSANNGTKPKAVVNIYGDKENQKEEQERIQDRAFAYEKERKAQGDEKYDEVEHGTVLIQERVNGKTGKLQGEEFYDQGFTGVQKDNYGKEEQRNYQYERKVREKKVLAPDLVKKVEPKKDKRRKENTGIQKKVKKKKEKLVYGTDSHPMRFARANGKFFI